MAISAKDVMTLRQRTGLGMMQCKTALAETNGDMEAAIALLRERLGKEMEERSGREAGEGGLAAARRNGAVALVELSSETDFSANTESFIAGAKKIAELALAQPDGEVQLTDAMKQVIDELRITIKENISFSRGRKLSGEKLGSYVHHNRKLGAIVVGSGDLSDELLTGICQHVTVADGLGQWAIPKAVDESGLPKDELSKQKQIFAEEAEATGKPPEIAEKIAGGKLRKWVDDHTLLGQIYVREMDAKKPIRDYLPKGAKVGGFVRYQLGQG